MKSRSRHLYLLIALLLALGVGIFLYRTLVLCVPLTETKTINSWMVEANLRFNAERNRPVKARFTIPYTPPSWVILDEYFVAQNYGVMTNLVGDNRQAVWSLRRSSGQQSLYYRAIFREASHETMVLRKPSYSKVQILPDNQKAVVDAIIGQARQASADIQTFAQSVIQELNKQDGNAKLLLQGDHSNKAMLQAIVQVLRQAKVDVLPVQGFYLKQENKAEVKWYLAIHDGKNWFYLNPETATVGLPKSFLIWQYGAEPLFDVSGGKNPQFNITVSPTPMNALYAAKVRGLQVDSKLMRFSLLELPVNTQETYKILLMIPLGAFIILLLRNFIGLKTFGTFMPVLIALAFRETELVWGILLFTLIVSFGLLVRFYLNELRLLLVPRLSIILTVVVLMMLFISILSQSLNLSAGLSLALFPMVILTMTIERMCITWDERGAFEAIKCGLGSLFAAVITYTVMNLNALQYLMFAFPELLFVLVALILIFGQYQGYRLVELFRFKALAEPH